uniref:Glycosyltransferase n=1 Tax=Kalanchoe fedtschenkoi TaxID=63787 RepID=A0A7N0UQU5_KALFE
MTRHHHHHFVVLSFPAQGHINPNLQFSKRLLRIGVRVTFVASSYARLGTSTAASKLPDGLTFVEYDDGYDGKVKQGDEAKQRLARMKQSSSEALQQVVSSAALEGCPVTCIAYSLLLPWAAAVARELHVLSALIWIQPATVFDIYYYYFHGFDGVMRELEDQEPSSTIDLPGLPISFTRRDLPSFVMPKNSYPAALDIFREHMAELEVETSARVLVNTFDALEPEALRSVSKLKLTAVGPLIPSAYLGGEDPSDTGFGVDLYPSTDNTSYVQWLDSKPHSSVIYVSFGSISVLSKQQMEEIGRGLLDMGKPFLWVIRECGSKSGEDSTADSEEDGDQKLISCMEELEHVGVIVPWCSQLQVLSHPAISCFFTHCGWNSTMESLISGVPMVGFPQWTDQSTNAKLVEDCWRTGARVNPNGDGLVERDEVKRLALRFVCLNNRDFACYQRLQHCLLVALLLNPLENHISTPIPDLLHLLQTTPGGVPFSSNTVNNPG